jgi:hypothetical protein
MEFSTTARSMFAGALCAGLVCGVANAADLAVKAVKAPPAPVFDGIDVHGIFDLTFASGFQTPRGLLVENNGLTTQATLGLSIDVYKNASGFINGVSVDFGTWNNLWSNQHDASVSSWNEMDWWVGANIKFAQSWTLGVHYWQFLPPAHDLPTSFPSAENNVEFALSYDDSWTNLPVAFHPYVKFWDHVSGPSNVVLGKKSDTFDVELGIVPTVDLTKSTGLPIVVTAPTWVTVGPTDFWNRNDGTTALCGVTSNQPCSLSNAGVFATGLTGKTTLDAWVPKKYGSWYVKYGFQYYHIINDALLGAQELTAAASGISTVNGTFTQARRDNVIGFGGIGFTF